MICLKLEKIQELSSVSEIFSYIVEESCEYSNVNKNLDISEWNAVEDKIYMVNRVIDKNSIESSLDLLIISNSRNHRNIHMQSSDSENSIAQARASLFFLFCDYFSGKYDNELEREFGFRVEKNIEQFKKLFLKENIDKFCSYLLIKSQQIERKSLENRVVEYQKIDGKWKSISKYLNINMRSWEQALEDEDKMSIESFLYKINKIQDEQHRIENYHEDSVYTQMITMLDCLTEKQKIFFYGILDDENITSFENYLKSDDEYMNRQCKASYQKNIIKRLSRELDSCPNVKKSNGYYSLKKMDNHRFCVGLKSQKNNKEKMKWISNAIRKNDTRAKEITDILIEENVLNYFQTYIKKEENIELYRFLLNNNEFNKIIEKIIKRLGEEIGRN